MYGSWLFFVVSKKGNVYTNFTTLIFCTIPKLYNLFKFASSTGKGEEEEKKKMNNSKSGYFRFDTFLTVQMDPVFSQTYVSVIILRHTGKRMCMHNEYS